MKRVLSLPTIHIGEPVRPLSLSHTRGAAVADKTAITLMIDRMMTTVRPSYLHWSARQSTSAGVLLRADWNSDCNMV